MNSDEYTSHIDHRSCACEKCLEMSPFNRSSSAWRDWIYDVDPFPPPRRIDGMLDWDWEIAVARKTAALAVGGVYEQPSLD